MHPLQIPCKLRHFTSQCGLVKLSSDPLLPGLIAMGTHGCDKDEKDPHSVLTFGELDRLDHVLATL